MAVGANNRTNKTTTRSRAVVRSCPAGEIAFIADNVSSQSLAQSHSGRGRFGWAQRKQAPALPNRRGLGRGGPCLPCRSVAETLSEAEGSGVEGCPPADSLHLI